MPQPDPTYTAEAVQRQLNTLIIGKQIDLYPQVNSTNDLAREAGRKGAREGLVILTDEQVRGRGRLGRTWTAPPGSSILCYPPPPPLLPPTSLLPDHRGLPGHPPSYQANSYRRSFAVRHPRRHQMAQRRAPQRSQSIGRPLRKRFLRRRLGLRHRRLRYQRQPPA